MKSVTVELTPDAELGGYTARLPDIPAYGEGETEEAAITIDFIQDDGKTFATRAAKVPKFRAGKAMKDAVN